MALRPGNVCARTHPDDHRPRAGADGRASGRTIRWARLYDLGTTVLSFGRVSALRRTTVERAGIAPGERILDVGCGPGRLTVLAGSVAGPAGEACGIDPAPEMAALARRNAARAGVAARFEVGVIEALPYPDDRFDVVLSSLMLHHLCALGLRTGRDHAERLGEMLREARLTRLATPTRRRGTHRRRLRPVASDLSLAEIERRVTPAPRSPSP